jgi:hypothetical protein
MAPLSGTDVDVGVEEVFGIVFGLELSKAAVVGPVGSGCRIPLFVVIEIVHVACRGKKRFQFTKCPATPGDARIVLARVHPLGNDADVEAG